MKTILSIVCFIASLSVWADHRQEAITSPNGNLEAVFSIDNDGMYIQLLEGNTVLLDKSSIDLEIQGKGFR